MLHIKEFSSFFSSTTTSYHMTTCLGLGHHHLHSINIHKEILIWTMSFSHRCGVGRETIIERYNCYEKY